MSRHQAEAEGVDRDGKLLGLHPERVRNGTGALDDDSVERASHLLRALSEAPSEGRVAGGVGEEFEVQRAPFGVAGHRVERVLSGELCLAAGCLHIVRVGFGEDLAEVLGAFGAAAIEQLENSSSLSAKL